MAYNFTIQLTPIGQPRLLGCSKVNNNEFIVYGAPGNFFWLVHASRNNIIVEPNKNEVEIKGDGPYKYIV